MSTSRLLAGLGAAALLFTAGCTSSESGSGRSGGASGATPPVTDATGSSPSLSSPTTGTSPSADDDVTAALLSAAEVGSGYTASDRSSTGSSLPCTPTKPGLFTQAPPEKRAERAFTNGSSTVQISQTVAAYDEDSGAQAAYAIGSAGFACSSGTLGDSAVRIVKRAGGTPTGSDIDQFDAWDFAAEGVKGTAVLVRLGDHLLAMNFVASGTAGNSVPVGQIVDRAAAKVAAND